MLSPEHPSTVYPSFHFSSLTLNEIELLSPNQPLPYNQFKQNYNAAESQIHNDYHNTNNEDGSEKNDKHSSYHSCNNIATSSNEEAKCNATHCCDEWNLQSWKQYEAKQQPEYSDLDVLENHLNVLRQSSPIVEYTEIRNLLTELRDVKDGKKFIIQAGDCAERFDECSLTHIWKKIVLLKQMENIIVRTSSSLSKGDESVLLLSVLSYALVYLFCFLESFNLVFYIVSWSNCWSIC